MSVRYYLIPVVTPEEQVVLDKFGLEALPIRLGTLVPHRPFMFDLIEGWELSPYTQVDASKAITSLEELIRLITPLVEGKVLRVEDEEGVEVPLGSFLKVVEERKDFPIGDGYHFGYDAQGYCFYKG